VAEQIDQGAYPAEVGEHLCAERPASTFSTRRLSAVKGARDRSAKARQPLIETVRLPPELPRGGP